MKKLLSLAVASVAFSAAVNANAHVSEAEWAQFKSQFAVMSERVNALEKENEALRGMRESMVTVEDIEQTYSDMEKLKSHAKATSWSERIKWKGDFRYRYEDISEDGKDDRERHRIRARTALIAQATDNVEIGLGFATGGDDPVSTNQTLGGGGSTKDIRLDLAYFKWKPNEFFLGGGKYVNPYYKPYKSGLIWDGDLRPEGLFVGYAGDKLFANATYIHLNSDSKDGVDEAIWGLQAGTNIGPVTLAAGYLDVPTKGLPPIYDGAFFGNSSEAGIDGDVYAYDYELITLGADASFNIGDLPLGLYLDYVQNQDADDNDQGYIIGAKLGSARKQGSWQLQYQYQELEADATFALVTDSDFMGGGTDGKGHKIGAAYALQSNWTLGFTYFDGEKCFDDIKCEARDYDRLMVDTKFKY